jgi:hypothetical protein
MARSSGRPFASAGHATVSGYSLNNRSFSAALDNTQTAPTDRCGFGSAHLAHSAALASVSDVSALPKRTVFKPLSNFLETDELIYPGEPVRKSAAHPHTYLSNNTLSFRSQAASGAAAAAAALPLLSECAPAAESGYTLNAHQAVSFPPPVSAAEAAYQARRDPSYRPPYSTTYYAEQAVAPLLATRHPLDMPPYEATNPTFSGYTRATADAPCGGTGTNDAAVFAAHRVGRDGPFRHGFYPSGQTKIATQRQIPLTTEEKALIGASRFGSSLSGLNVHGGALIDGSNGSVLGAGAAGAGPFAPRTNLSTYGAAYADPEQQARPGKESKSLAQTLTAQAAAAAAVAAEGGAWGRTQTAAGATAPFRSTRPLAGSVLLKPTTTTYDRTYVQHPLPLPM